MSISILLATFANNILPILLIAGAGFVLGKVLPVEARSLGRVIFYVFSPLLVFDLLIQNYLEVGEALGVISLALCVVVSMGLITFILGSLFKLERPVLTAILITTMFANTGNYGLPLVSFAFGEEALSYAGIYFVTIMFLFNTVGVLIASLGHMNFREALLGLFKVPTLYAVLLAIPINLWQIQLPASLGRAVQLGGSGTIPLMLILLGVELARVQFSGSQRAMQLSVSLRLIVSPALALLFAALFGLSGPAWQASVTESGMPTIVSSTVLATEYNLDSRLVTTTIFISTLLSPFTLTPLLVFLGR